ncbi:MAG: ABC transporter permease subunit [Actinomycetales bacterium]|nr:ABC transporter permease subunit [Actinomycetales bacterium]
MIRTRKLPLALAMLLAGVYVLLPIVAATEFSLRQPAKGDHGFDNYAWFMSDPDFGKYLGISFGLAAYSAIILLVVLVPTVVWLNLNGAKFRPFVEFISLMPLVIPVVALAIGAQTALPEFAQTDETVLAYMFAVLALPYAYRTMDTGLRSVPLRTLVEAARGLGAGWIRTILLVIIPVVRGSVLNALFMTLALSLGEFTLTSLLHWDTFTTWVTTMSQSNILGAIALSMFSLGAVFALLLGVGLFVRHPKSNVVSEEE